MDALVNKVIMTIGKRRLDEAAHQFKLSTITELLQKNHYIDFKIPNLEAFSDFGDIERFIRSIMKLQLFRIQNTSNLFKDDTTNVITMYKDSLSCLNQSETLMNSVGFFQNLIVQCKQDMKLYWKLPVQVLDRHVESIISELRELFKSYKSYGIAKGVLLSVNNLFWFYFQINEFQQCTFFVRPIKDQIDSLLVGIAKSYTVTFYYYYGKMKIYEGDKERAVEYLEKAFLLCHSKYHAHKIKILRLLIPFKMLCGTLPSEELIEKYSMQEYSGIIQAIKTGDMKLFEDCKHKNKRKWIRRGIYFVVDNLELILMRRLFKTVWLLGDKQTVVPTELFQKALNLKSQYKFDLLETECLIGNLILKGYLRACVYPEQKKTVFPADKAFPNLVTLFQAGNN